MTIYCRKCQGEGSLYTSKYGGNDPDVWKTGDCEACNGSGTQKCEARGCDEDAIAFNDDGDALCEDCLFEWVTENFDDMVDFP